MLQKTSAYGAYVFPFAYSFILFYYFNNLIEKLVMQAKQKVGQYYHAHKIIYKTVYETVLDSLLVQQAANKAAMQNGPQNATLTKQAIQQAAMEAQKAASRSAVLLKYANKDESYDIIYRTVRDATSNYVAAKHSVNRAAIKNEEQNSQQTQKTVNKLPTQKEVQNVIRAEKDINKTQSWGGLFRQIKLWFGKGESSSSQGLSSSSLQPIHSKNTVVRKKEEEESGRKQFWYSEQQTSQTTSLIPQEIQDNDKKNK